MDNPIGNVTSPVRSPASIDDDDGGSSMEAETKRSVLGLESLSLDEGQRTTSTEENAVEGGGEKFLPSVSHELSSLGFVRDDSPPIRINLTQQSSSPHDSSSFDDNGDQLDLYPDLINQYIINNENLCLSQGQSAAYDSNHVQGYPRDYNYIPSMSSTHVAPVLQNEAEGFYHNNNVGQNPFIQTQPWIRNPLYSQCDDLRELKENHEYLQCLLVYGDAEITRKIYRRVLSSIFEIMKDEHGYYLFKKLMEVCNSVQKHEIVRNVTQRRDELVKVAKAKYGCRSVFELMRAVKGSYLLRYLTKFLAPGTFDLMIHTTGSFLIQECLVDLSNEDNWFIYEAALKHCDILARDSKGCFSLMRCINNVQAPCVVDILNKIVQGSLGLSTDKYGNYVVQHVLSLCDRDVTEKICSMLKEHLFELAMNKFGSFVVEQCIKSSGGQPLLRVLANCGKEKLEEIAQDQYGNYVLQQALKTKMNKNLHRALVHAIGQIPQRLMYHPNGRSVLKQVQKGFSYYSRPSFL